MPWPVRVDEAVTVASVANHLAGGEVDIGQRTAGLGGAHRCLLGLGEH